MKTDTEETRAAGPMTEQPELSIVMPCYNEGDVVGYTIPQLLNAFSNAGHRLELVAVDNGSRDRTGEVIRQLALRDPRVVPHRVEVNEGYGHGILRGIPLCRAPYIGIIPADGQVDAEDVVRLFEALVVIRGPALAKVRRRFRLDGLARKVVSVTYNLFVRALWPRLGSVDVNGVPKILPRDVLLAMGLESKDWLLDPEIMVKAHYMGVRVVEFNVFSRMRGNGLSHVRAATCWEFFSRLLRWRFSGELTRWRQTSDQVAVSDRVSAGP